MQIDQDRLIRAHQAADFYPFSDAAMVDAVLRDIEAQGFVVVPQIATPAPGR